MIQKFSFYSIASHLSCYLFGVGIFLTKVPSQVSAQYATPLNPGEGINVNLSPYNVPITASPVTFMSRLEAIFSMFLSFMTILTGLFFIVHFVIGGFLWSTAGGETQKIETAKTKMTNAAIGLIIVIASYSIIYIVGKVLGLNILNPGTLILNYLKPTP